MIFSYWIAERARQFFYYYYFKGFCFSSHDQKFVVDTGIICRVSKIEANDQDDS